MSVQEKLISYIQGGFLVNR